MAALDQRKQAATSVPSRDNLAKGFYFEEPGENFTPEMRDILETYSKISPSEVLPHIKKLREKAWAVYQYPCIGRFVFLGLSIAESHHFYSYPELISSLKNGQTLLDIGCCFGQDIRKLVYDGAPSENIYGSELRPEFVQLGYELFRDQETLKTKMITPGNIYDVRDKKGGLYELVEKGGVDNVYASAFIHLFDWEGQIEVCCLLTKLLKDKKGSKIIGRQVGAKEGTAHEIMSTASANGTNMWLQDGKSWGKLWEEVGKRTGTEGGWEVKSKSMEYRSLDEKERLYMFWFEVTRK